MKLHLLLNEPGSGEITIPMADPAAEDIQSGKIIRVTYRGDYRGAFFVEDISERRVTRGDYSGQEVTVRGRGAMAVLADAVVWYTAQGQTTREFANVHAVEPLITLVNEAKARGGLGVLTLDFDAVNDSTGAAWTDNRTLELRVGSSLLDVMRKIAGLGIDFSLEMDWARNIYYLRAFKNGRGSDKSDSVVFREGANCVEVGYTERSQELSNVILVEHSSGQFEVVSDATSISIYRRRERMRSASQAGASAEAIAYGQGELDDRKDPESAITIRVTDSAGPMAFVDYDVGDTVGYAKYDAQLPTSYRIQGMSLEWSGSQTWATVTLQLNALQRDLVLRTAVAAAKIGGSMDSKRAAPVDSLQSLSEHNSDPNAHPLRDEFIELRDTPGAYTSQAGKYVVVNAAEDGVEFFAPDGLRVYNNANIGVANDTLTALTFNAEDFDTNNMHDVSTNTSRLVCKTAGRYILTCQVWFAANGTGYRMARAEKNGTGEILCQVTDNNPSGSLSAILNLVTIVELAVDDYVEFIVYQNSGGNLNVQYYSGRSPVAAMQQV